MLEIARIKAISLDLDDTLWPIWPTIERAEKVLHDWLMEHAPMTAALFSSPSALREIRDYMGTSRPDLKNDLSALRNSFHSTCTDLVDCCTNYIIRKAGITGSLACRSLSQVGLENTSH